jgi:hypothetical protein
VVHRPVDRPRHRKARIVSALICCVALPAGCGGSSSSDRSPVDLPTPGVGSIRTANCTDWKKGSIDQRYGTVAQLRRFAGGPVGSSPQMQNGPVIDDGRAYRVLDSYCAKRFARAFKLYKLYERAAALLGHQAGAGLLGDGG